MSEEGRETETIFGCNILNRFLELGRAEPVLVGGTGVGKENLFRICIYATTPLEHDVFTNSCFVHRMTRNERETNR